jgi:hypothetical protein
VSLAGFRVIGFVGASGVAHSLNKPLSRKVSQILKREARYQRRSTAWRCEGEELPEGSSRESKLSL